MVNRSKQENFHEFDSPIYTYPYNSEKGHHVYTEIPSYILLLIIDKTYLGNKLSFQKFKFLLDRSTQRRINIPDGSCFFPTSKLFPESRVEFLYEAPLWSFSLGRIRLTFRCCISSATCVYSRYFVARYCHDPWLWYSPSWNEKTERIRVGKHE